MSLCTISPMLVHCVSLIFPTRTRVCSFFFFLFLPIFFSFVFAHAKRSFCNIYIYCGSRMTEDVGNLVCCDAQTDHYQPGINGLCAQYIQLFSEPQEMPWVMAIIA